MFKNKNKTPFNNVKQCLEAKLATCDVTSLALPPGVRERSRCEIGPPVTDGDWNKLITSSAHIHEFCTAESIKLVNFAGAILKRNGWCSKKPVYHKTAPSLIIKVPESIIDRSRRKDVCEVIVWLECCYQINKRELGFLFVCFGLFWVSATCRPGYWPSCLHLPRAGLQVRVITA